MLFYFSSKKVWIERPRDIVLVRITISSDTYWSSLAFDYYLTESKNKKHCLSLCYSQLCGMPALHLATIRAYEEKFHEGTNWYLENDCAVLTNLGYKRHSAILKDLLRNAKGENFAHLIVQFQPLSRHSLKLCTDEFRSVLSYLTCWKEIREIRSKR